MDLPIRFSRLDKALEAPQIVVDQQTVQPVATLTGWQLWDQGGRFASAWGRVTPHAIRVQEGSRAYTVPVVDPLHGPTRGFIVGALAVSGFCLAIMLIAGSLARRG